MIEALHHVQLAMPQGREEEARAFYVDILGFREIDKPRALQGRGGIWVRSGTVDLHLGVEIPFRPAQKAHPALRVTSLDQTMRHLEHHAVAYRRDDDLPSFRRVFIDDPFGNRIELLQLVG